MKKIVIITLLLAFIFSCEKEKKYVGPVDAMITMIINKVEKNAQMKWIKAKLYDKIENTGAARTLPKSRAEINIANKYRFLLLEKSIFVPEVLTTENITFKLKKGSIFARVSKLPEGQTLNVNTPTMVVGVRGTDFVLKANGTEETVSVREGAVTVRLNITGLKKALKHKNPSIQAIARQIKKGVKVRSFQQIVIKKEKIAKIEETLKIAMKKLQGIEQELNTITDLIQVNIENANISDFTEGLKHFNSRLHSTKGTAVTLDGAFPETEIYINNELVGRGYIGMVLSPGEYKFKFKNRTRTHVVNKSYDLSKKQDLIKYPFKRQVRREAAGPGSESYQPRLEN